MRGFWWGWDESVVLQGRGTFRECMNVTDVCRERACPFRTPGRALLLFGSPAEERAFSFLEKREAEKQATRARSDKSP